MIQVDRIVPMNECCRSPLLSFCPFLSTKTYWRLIWLKSVTWPNYSLSCWWSCQVTHGMLYVEDLRALSQELHCTAAVCGKNKALRRKIGGTGPTLFHGRIFTTWFCSILYTKKRHLWDLQPRRVLAFEGALRLYPTPNPSGQMAGCTSPNVGS